MRFRPLSDPRPGPPSSGYYHLMSGDCRFVCLQQKSWFQPADVAPEATTGPDLFVFQFHQQNKHIDNFGSRRVLTATSRAGLPRNGGCVWHRRTAERGAHITACDIILLRGKYLRKATGAGGASETTCERSCVMRLFSSMHAAEDVGDFSISTQPSQTSPKVIHY